MRSLALRNLSFAVCASAFLGLLPVIARDQLQLGAGGFGLLSGGFGLGAIAGAFDPMEREILGLVNLGLTNQEVGAKLGITVSSTKWYATGAR
jgi:DNA-binding NarL/FixJ family response regulator